MPGDAERTPSTLITQGPGASLHGASPETTSITDSAHTPLNCPPKVEDGALTSGPKWKSVVFTKTHVAVFPLKNVSMDYACMHAKLLQLCPPLCNPMDHSPPGSSVHRILQARILKWVAVPPSRGTSQPRDRTQVPYVSCIGRQVLYH